MQNLACFPCRSHPKDRQTDRSRDYYHIRSSRSNASKRSQGRDYQSRFQDELRRSQSQTYQSRYVNQSKKQSHTSRTRSRCGSRHCQRGSYLSQSPEGLRHRQSQGYRSRSHESSRRRQADHQLKATLKQRGDTTKFSFLCLYVSAEFTY